MSIRLRPHHLLCLLTFAGHGYSRAFIVNFADIVERLHRGERIELVDGPDDVCAPVCMQDGSSAHCYNQSVVDRDDLARVALAPIAELAPLFGVERAVGLNAATIAALRHVFASGRIRGACSGCEWSPLCSEIAANAFSETLL